MGIINRRPAGEGIDRIVPSNKIVVPPQAKRDPAFGNKPVMTWDDTIVVFDEEFNVIHVIDDGGCQQLESIEALYTYLKG